MADLSNGNGLTRSAKRRPRMAYRLITGALIVALTASLARVSPAAAAHAPAASGGSTALVTAMKSIMGTPPATFRASMNTYLAQAQQIARANPDMDKKYALSTYVKDAQTILATNDQQALTQMYFATQRTPNWQQALQMIKQYSPAYHSALRWQANHVNKNYHPSAKIGTRALGDDCPPSPGIIPVVVVNGLFALAGIPYTIAPDSFTVVVLGEGATTPSPYKIIAAIIYIVVLIAQQILNDLYSVNNDCVGAEHTAQLDNLDQYTRDNAAVKTVDIKVTTIDTYHYSILTSENGTPVPASITAFNAVKLLSTGPTTVSIPTSQVVAVPNATGLFVATIPPTKIGSSYEISVQNDDGGTASSTNPGGVSDVVHNGSTVFSR